jgi:hypothetical protein
MSCSSTIEQSPKHAEAVRLRHGRARGDARPEQRLHTSAGDERQP